MERYRTVKEKKYKTELVPETRYCHRTQTTMVSREIPVYDVVLNTPQTCTSAPVEVIPRQDPFGATYQTGTAPAERFENVYSGSRNNIGARVTQRERAAPAERTENFYSSRRRPIFN